MDEYEDLEIGPGHALLWTEKEEHETHRRQLSKKESSEYLRIPVPHTQTRPSPFRRLINRLTTTHRIYPIVLALFLLIASIAYIVTVIVQALQPKKPWETYCREQQPFPHELANSLAPVSVFVGVFSVDAAYERRQLIRNTYLRQSLPTWRDPAYASLRHADNSTSIPTNIQVRFVIGRPRDRHAHRIALEMEEYGDMVILDIEENMNKGKTHAYFKWASENAIVHGEVADYIVKADDDSLVVLSELERHLRVTPREKTYWGYLVKNRFMTGEAYALSRDLVHYIASYSPISQHTIGNEDKIVAVWMDMHPATNEIHRIGERCWIYDHPMAPTSYSHRFIFPEEVEVIRSEEVPEKEGKGRGWWDKATAWTKSHSVDPSVESTPNSLSPPPPYPPSDSSALLNGLSPSPSSLEWAHWAASPDRYLNLPYGGTVVVHYLKRNDWFLDAAVTILGRQRAWEREDVR